MAQAPCIFCRIAERQLPARLAHEDEQCVAFDDLNPQAPHHVLVVPRRHLATWNDAAEADAPLLGHLALVAREIAAARGKTDYRLVLNCGPEAGQSVFHIHLHLLAGRAMGWPPG